MFYPFIVAWTGELSFFRTGACDVFKPNSLRTNQNAESDSAVEWRILSMSHLLAVTAAACARVRERVCVYARVCITQGCDCV